MNLEVALKFQDSKHIILPTRMKDRPDVTAYMNDGINYDASGYEVYLEPEEHREIHKNVDYDIYVIFDNGKIERLVKTGAIVRWED